LKTLNPSPTLQSILEPQEILFRIFAPPRRSWLITD
jgi:hypothetical protein